MHKPKSDISPVGGIWLFWEIIKKVFGKRSASVSSVVKARTR